MISSCTICHANKTIPVIIIRKVYLCVEATYLLEVLSVCDRQRLAEGGESQVGVLEGLSDVRGVVAIQEVV